MILDLERFIAEERPRWRALQEILDRLEADPLQSMDLDALRRFHLLYRRASADLARVATFSSEPEIRSYLESLVSRAYGEIHETRRRSHLHAPWRLFTHAFPRAFRAHARVFALAVCLVMTGALFGGVAILADAGAREALLPFPHLRDDPRARVAREEQTRGDRLEGSKTTFSATLATHNTQVAILSLALGMTWGVGTVLLLFYNGVILGAVVADYAAAGQVKFLLGWLLPHGVVEIPAFLIAGQAGLLLAQALIGRGDRAPLKARLRAAGPDLGALIAGVAGLLLWAGFVEAFLSQYHEPVLPYGIKIGIGLLELGLLVLYLTRAGASAGAGRAPASATLGNVAKDGP